MCCELVEDKISLDLTPPVAGRRYTAITASSSRAVNWSVCVWGGGVGVCVWGVGEGVCVYGGVGEGVCVYGGVGEGVCVCGVV